jgi:hypothetical protein
MKHYIIILIILFSCLTKAENAPALRFNDEVQKLARHPQWHALLHYHEERSLADDQHFFLAPTKGPVSLVEELHATLMAFAAPIANADEHAQCRFPARRAFIQQHHPALAAQWPTVTCSKYQAWRSNFIADRAYLLFPSAAINNPPAMFGHTLLRLPSPRSGASSPLLDFTVNYGADYNGETGLRYAWRGITGFYPGKFDILRYYVEHTSYLDYRDRDIWEYRLKLSPAEIDLMLAHLWELLPIRFDYYFFDENCSYQLLTLIQAAKPDYPLSEELDIYAIPADAVRVLAKYDLIEYNQYHPSLSHQIEQLGETLSPLERERAQSLALSPTHPEPLANYTPAQLELAYLIGQRNLYQQPAADNATQRQHMHNIATERAKHASSKPASTPSPPQFSPERGHETSRWRLGYHHQANTEWLSVAWRAAYHDLLDPANGYPEGAQIDFLDLGLQYNITEQSATINHFTAVDIWSLAPWHYGLHPWSWRVTLAYRDHVPQWQGHGVGSEIALGHTAYNASWGHIYLMGTLAATAAPALEKHHTTQGGLRLGWLSPSWGPWRHWLNATHSYAVTGDARNWRSLQWEQRWQLSPQQGLRLRWERDYVDDIGLNTASAIYERYF